MNGSDEIARSVGTMSRHTLRRETGHETPKHVQMQQRQWPW